MRILVIDDLRSFRFDTEYEVHYARTSAAGLDLLNRAATNPEPGPFYDEIWLDHDLGGDDTIRPCVLWLEGRAVHGEAPVTRRLIFHTANASAGESLMRGLSKRFDITRVDASDYVD